MEMLRIFHREGTTEERILRDVNTLENLGYLRKLGDEQNSFEARRIIKAIMTAEWVAEYQDKVLAATGAYGDPPPIADGSDEDRQQPAADGDTHDLADAAADASGPAPIVLTRHDGDQFALAAIAAGADDCLVKG